MRKAFYEPNKLYEELV
uniref:Uncharacterized protein n=1 Tax=Anguilla anguilla TaxID=7936 RepID=A0A0E9VU68_ANGAN